MSYLTQCCGLAILAAILYFYLFRRKILIKTGRSYLLLVVVTIICTIWDITSVYFLMHENEIANRFLVTFICKSYVSSLCTVALCGLRYLCADVYKSCDEFKFALRIIFAIWVVMTTVIYALPIYTHYNNGIPAYTEGPSTLATYICVAIVIVLIIVVLEKNRKKVNINRRKAIYFWIFCWSLSALIQFTNPDILIVSFGSAIGVMVIYLALENPESQMDRRTSYFNETALSMYAEDHFAYNRGFSLISIRIESLNYEGKKLSFDGDAMSEINTYLENFEKGDLFILKDNEFVLAFNDKVFANDALELIKERFGYGWGSKKNIMLPSKFMYVPAAGEFDSWDDLNQAMRFVNYSAEGAEKMSVVTPASLDALIEEREIEDVIREAIDNDRVEVFYQPIYSVSEKKFISSEALARIRKADGTIVPPNKFIPIAEKNGTIIKIGEIVFEKVCQLLSREMLNERFDVKYIEINLSTVQCAYDNLADSFVAIMNRNHVNPAWINLEITESASLSSKKILLKNMRELMLYGVTFSLDDFGTGNSNINYIMDMPVSIVKFDREVINSYFTNEKAKHIMSSMIKMLKELNTLIVAEGIETKNQSDIIIGAEADFIQGYYYSKPLTRGDYINFLENSNGLMIE